MVADRLQLQARKRFAFEDGHFMKPLDRLLLLPLQQTLHPFSLLYVRFELLVVHWLEDCVSFLSRHCSP